MSDPNAKIFPKGRPKLEQDPCERKGRKRIGVALVVRTRWFEIEERSMSVRVVLEDPSRIKQKICMLVDGCEDVYEKR